MDNMNEAQSKTLEEIKQVFEADGRTIREINVKMLDGTAFVAAETGVADDDGMLDAVRARRGYCFWIGPRGGIYEWHEGKKRRMNADNITDIYAQVRENAKKAGKVIQ